MARYYGNEIKSGNYGFECYVDYTTTETDTTYSVTVTEIGVYRTGNKSVTWNLNTFTSTSIADGYSQTTKTPSSSSWTCSPGASRSIITTAITYTWDKTSSTQSKTLTTTTKKKSGTPSGTSTYTVTFTIPALPSMLKVKTSGGWVSGTPKVKVNGSWVSATKVLTKSSGTWS